MFFFSQIKQLYQKESPIFSPPQAPTNDNALKKTTYCLNNGKLVDNACKCIRGYKGARCEHSVCYNYCLNGSCAIDHNGLPSCVCPLGWSGARCEVDPCQGVCLNDGRCFIGDDDENPQCECQSGFSGRRCEVRVDMTEQLCKVYCGIKNAAEKAYLSEEMIQNFKTIVDDLSQKSLRVCE